MKVWKVTASVVVVAAIAGGAAWYWFDRSVDSTTAVSIDATDAELVALGRRVYAAECAACHGVNLEGEPNWRERKANGRMPAPPHDASGHTWHHADGLLFALTKYGIAKVSGRLVDTDMPAYDTVLADREIAASLAYIKSQWPAEIRKRHDAMNRNQAKTR